MDPLVSIIIPTRNRAELLQETLRSLSDQSYPNWEAIVVDDGSSDGTDKYVLSEALRDPRFKYIVRTTLPAGASPCRNIGFEASKGEYIIFLDSDDLLDGDCLKNRLRVISEKEVGFAVFMTRVFKKYPGDDPRFWNTFTSEDDLNRYLKSDMPWNTSGPIWKRSSLLKIGPWDEDCLSAQDWEFHIRAIASGIAYIKIPHVDSSWRDLRSDSISFSWLQNEKILSRAKVACRVVAIMMNHHLWSEQRRRLMLAYYHRSVFALCIDFKTAFAVWMQGYRAAFIKWHEFHAVLSIEFLYRLVLKIKKKLTFLILHKPQHLSSHLKVGLNTPAVAPHSRKT